ncbi:DsbA family protein [Rhizobium sp. Root1220]|uniref:DsbA family protein n=1 Tax=Rhizobium sp. Root1220 TaxID=1736432 RepID=UPI0006FD5303|nr:DsbA family protein [Rhizobium sp. Root1220]KQV68098.1 thioredoxin [Rhizobium sp. Root1220]
MKLTLVADPMCSWCYGFTKEMTELQQRHPEMELEVVMGGLRAGGTDVLDDAGKQFRLHHWAKVEQASGVPFNREGLMSRKGFVYDTEPVCRAVVTAGILAPKADLLKVLRAFQHAFYVDALDTTDGSVLAKVGADVLSEIGYAVSAAEFLAAWREPSTIRAASAEFARARSMGVTSFPALFLHRNDRLHPVGTGYAQIDSLERDLRKLIAA